MPINNPGFRCAHRLSHSDRRSRLESREIIGGRLDFLSGDRVRDLHHSLWVSPGYRCLSRAAFEIRHLLRNVRSGKTGNSRVFRAARAVGPMTRAAREHSRPSSPSYDFGHRRMIVRVPIGAKVQIADLGEREARIAVRYPQAATVIGRLGQTWRVDGIGPCRRPISEWRASARQRR
jgi:hypothetical protein